LLRWNLKIFCLIIACLGAELLSCASALGQSAPRETLEKIPASGACQAETVKLQLHKHALAVRQISGAILFNAGMLIDADGAPNAYGPHDHGLDFTKNAKSGRAWAGVVTDVSGKPVVQRSGAYRGLYVSQTTLHARGTRIASSQTYVNASKVPFIALPPEFTEQFGVEIGDLALVANTRNGKRAYAIFADVGPSGKIGEGSIALAKALGINANPRRGGVASGISYLVFPESGLGQGTLRTRGEINTSGARFFRQWGGSRRLRACGSNSN